MMGSHEINHFSHLIFFQILDPYLNFLLCFLFHLLFLLSFPYVIFINYHLHLHLFQNQEYPFLEYLIMIIDCYYLIIPSSLALFFQLKNFLSSSYIFPQALLVSSHFLISSFPIHPNLNFLCWLIS